MRIVIDIDGTISELKKLGQTYDSININEGALAKIRALKKAGHYIILQTARHMKTCNGDLGQVVAKVGKQTLDWLELNNVPYDEIYFGKPYADVYIDDLAYKFTDWESIGVSNFDDAHTNILIPMAGLGSRFSQAGFTNPKPLIEVNGKTLVEWAISSLSFLINKSTSTLIFVILKEHDVQFNLSKKLKDIFSKDIIIIVVDSLTSGQAATCLAAKSTINNLNQLIIYNCDTYTTGNEKILKLVQEERPDGILASFESTDPRYSYAKCNKNGYITMTKEKEVISNQASTGLYYFRRGSDFVTAAENIIQNSKVENGEYYVAPVYNELLKSGKKIKTYKVEQNWILGTPEEMEFFKKEYRK
jgi:capsule biosynthesis phosphatase